MAVDLDLPFEDEALYSVVARYFRSMRVGNFRGALIAMFGSGSWLPAGRPHNLEHLAEQCRYVWPWSAREIAERLTVYPYFAALLTNESAETLLKQICERTGTHLTGRALVMGVRLRYCAACLAADRAEGRPAYWRREHQLPGVLICPRHQQWLVEANPGRVRRQKLLIPDPSDGFSEPLALGLTSAQTDACLRVSQMSAELLHNRISVLPEGLVCQFKERARAAGFAFGPERIRTLDLKHAFVKHFGEPFLRHTSAFPEEGHSWMTSLFRGVLPQRCVHKTVLIAEFLSSQQVLECSEAWPICPNKRAISKHTVNLRTRCAGGYVAKCSCGFSFKYSGIENGIPQHVKPTRYTFLAEDVSRLRREGWTYKAIAARFHIAIGTVENLCARPPDDGWPLSPEARSRMIAEWHNAVREFGCARAAGRARIALYVRVRRYARECL